MQKKACQILFLLFFRLIVCSQNTALKVGDVGLPLILSNNENTQQSISFPYINKIVLVHFWSSSVSKSKPYIPRLIDLYNRYSVTTYRNTDGFEIVTVAVQSDKTTWNKDLVEMEMNPLTNLIAIRGYNDLSVRGYKISQLPLTLLIDENGIIIQINPTMLEIESVLDGKKNSPQNTKDIKGRLQFSSSSKDVIKGQKMVLMNKFGDTISKTITENSGLFTFYDVKFLSDYIIKTDTSGTLQLTPKIFIYTSGGTLIKDISKSNGVFQSELNSDEIAKMISNEKEISAVKNAVTIKTGISFKSGTADLESNSSPEMDKLVTMLSKNKDYTIEIYSHTESRGEDAENMELSKKRANSVKNYFVNKGIPAAKIKTIGKGETEIINKCKNNVNCTDIEHAENNRIEIKFYKP